MSDQGVPIVEAVAVGGPTNAAGQGQMIPVYAQPLDAMPNGTSAGSNYPSSRADVYASSRSSAAPSAQAYDEDQDELETEYEMYEREFGRSSRSRSGRQSRDYVHGFEPGPNGTVVVLTERRPSPGGLMRLAMACYVWAVMAFVMIVIAISWYNRQQKEISEEELAQREDDGAYTEDGDDDYWEERRRREESESLFEIIYRFTVFIFYVIIICNQRVLSLIQLYAKPVYEWVTRFWVFEVIVSVITLAVIDSELDAMQEAYDVGNDDQVDWDKYERLERAHFGVRLTADFIDLFYFIFSGYVYMKTADRLAHPDSD